MLKQTKRTITTNEVTNNQRVVKEIVETRTTTDGKVITSTKRITTVNGNEFNPSFKEINLLDSSHDEQNIENTSGKQVLEGNAEEKKKESGKSLAERLGFKSKTKTKTDTGRSMTGVKCTDATEFEDEALKSHNAFRKKHGVPPLALSRELCSYSQEWADHLADTKTFQHRSERKYGENIYTKWSSNPNHVVNGNDAVESWYSEIKDHVFGKEPTSLKSGHFTQVIWKESKLLGVAISRSKDGRVYVVANYDPAGNFIGKFAENVPPVKK